MIGILILLALIIINGLVVLSEIALIAAKKSKLEQSAAKGDANAKKLSNCRKNLKYFYQQLKYLLL
ncbi:MAG: CNNM domain-containing protein [Chitinophagaceae bacterium]